MKYQEYDKTRYLRLLQFRSEAVTYYEDILKVCKCFKSLYVSYNYFGIGKTKIKANKIDFFIIALVIFVYIRWMDC